MYLILCQLDQNVIAAGTALFMPCDIVINVLKGRFHRCLLCVWMSCYYCIQKSILLRIHANNHKFRIWEVTVQYKLLYKMNDCTYISWYYAIALIRFYQTSLSHLQSFCWFLRFWPWNFHQGWAEELAPFNVLISPFSYPDQTELASVLSASAICESYVLFIVVCLLHEFKHTHIYILL